MNWSHELDTWIVVVGTLCSLSCALLGNFLVLRRMSMMGDAISHAVLPGLAGGFLLMVAVRESTLLAKYLPGVSAAAQNIDPRNPVVMLVGAAVVGVLTTLFTQWVHNFGKVDRGASMGVVFTSLFALGLIMIVRAADHVDLDPGCVLYGAIEYTPMYKVTLMKGVDVPRAAVVLGVVLLINSAFVALFFKELKITSFDPALATTLGINARLMHYLLMTLVAVTTVACFESIGSILVIAMLIVPPAAAHLLTDRLGPMILVSLVIAAASAAVGHAGAITVPMWFGFSNGTSTSSAMAMTAGGFFTLVLFLAPRYGVISRMWHRARLSLRILQEDALGLLYRMEEMGVTEQSPPLPTMLRQVMGISPIFSRLALSRLESQGRIKHDGERYRLTESGRGDAVELVRAHRLWESYLHRFLTLPADHVHTTAEKLEHVTDAKMAKALVKRLEHPTRDPQDKAIPTNDE